MINCHCKSKTFFIKNESVNPYNTRDGKLLFIPNVNTTHFGTKSLRYDWSFNLEELLSEYEQQQFFLM